MSPSAEYLSSIITPLLSEPSSLVIKESQDAMGTLLNVQLHNSDMPQVIGKGGATADAVRTLVRTFGGLNQARVAVKFDEPEGGRYHKNK